jgi:lipoprotein-anchoring transpeptidase ErfK/SrfK
MMHKKRPIRTAIAILVMAILGTSAACSTAPLPGQAVATGQADATSAEPAPVAVVTAAPALGDQQLSPVEPVTITVAKGTLSSLTVTNPEGAPVAGTLSADKTSWTLAEPLGYGRTYTVTGAAVGTDGQTVPIAGSYTTVTPTAKVTSKISPGDNVVVGVAAPVIVRFGSAPTDKTLIEKHVTITTTPKVEGAWAWITHDGDTWPSLDWRPKTYWPSGTTVHVESDLYGLDLGGGSFGGDKVTSDFTIGRNQVVKADANAHTMIVQQNGVTVATYDASYGSGDVIGDPNRVTRSGIHIVMDKKETTTMSNPAYGYTDVTEHWAVRISDNGEFIHQNQDTVAAQGVDNVSHGCVNLSPQDAQAYFQTAIYGDPVEVTGTSVQLSPADGDIYDWAIPWTEWTTLANN